MDFLTLTSSRDSAPQLPLDSSPRDQSKDKLNQDQDSSKREEADSSKTHALFGKIHRAAQRRQYENSDQETGTLNRQWSAKTKSADLQGDSEQTSLESRGDFGMDPMSEDSVSSQLNVRS